MVWRVVIKTSSLCNRPSITCIQVLAMTFARLAPIIFWLEGVCSIQFVLLLLSGRPSCASAMVIKKAKSSHDRVNRFLRGVIYGMFLVDTPITEIRDEVHKPDGSPVSAETARYSIQMVKDNGGLFWDGDVAALSAAGRPRETLVAYRHWCHSHEQVTYTSATMPTCVPGGDC